MFTVQLRFSALALLLVLVLVLSGCGLLSTTSLRAAPPVSATHTIHHSRHATPAPQATQGDSEVIPTRLIIPTIGVNAAIERVEILANSNLATPTGHPWDDAGWYDLGTRPGAQGSAVIDGHLDRPGGYPAVFWNLRKLHSGDEVMVVGTQGKTLRFRVLQVAFYAPQAAPLQNIFGNYGGSYLNLITCAGDWIPSQHQTTLRLVVYTQLIS